MNINDFVKKYGEVEGLKRFYMAYEQQTKWGNANAAGVKLEKKNGKS